MAERHNRSMRLASSAVGFLPSMMRASVERLTPARRAISIRGYPNAMSPAKCSAAEEGCGGVKAVPMAYPEMGRPLAGGGRRNIQEARGKRKENRAAGV